MFFYNYCFLKSFPIFIKGLEAFFLNDLQKKNEAVMKWNALLPHQTF